MRAVRFGQIGRFPDGFTKRLINEAWRTEPKLNEVNKQDKKQDSRTACISNGFASKHFMWNSTEPKAGAL